MEDLVKVLTKFHREVVVPDIERIVGKGLDGLRGEMHAGFDALAQRLDRLLELKTRVDGLQEPIQILEARLGSG